MSQLLAGVPGIICHMDDVLVHEADMKSHLYYSRSSAAETAEGQICSESAKAMAHYDHTLETFITTDASNVGLGGATLARVQKDGSR